MKQVSVLVLLSMVVASLFSCAGKKQEGRFGAEVNLPKFEGPGEFMRSLWTVNKILVAKKLEGGKVDGSWIDPKFREKLCLTVTINNHCVA